MNSQYKTEILQYIFDSAAEHLLALSYFPHELIFAMGRTSADYCAVTEDYGHVILSPSAHILQEYGDSDFHANWLKPRQYRANQSIRVACDLTNLTQLDTRQLQEKTFPELLFLLQELEAVYADPELAVWPTLLVAIACRFYLQWHRNDAITSLLPVVNEEPEEASFIDPIVVAELETTPIKVEVETVSAEKYELGEWYTYVTEGPSPTLKYGRLTSIEVKYNLDHPDGISKHMLTPEGRDADEVLDMYHSIVTQGDSVHYTVFNRILETMFERLKDA